MGSTHNSYRAWSYSTDIFDAGSLVLGINRVLGVSGGERARPFDHFEALSEKSIYFFCPFYLGVAWDSAVGADIPAEPYSSPSE